MLDDELVRTCVQYIKQRFTMSCLPCDSLIEDVVGFIIGSTKIALKQDSISETDYAEAVSHAVEAFTATLKDKGLM